ncbi:ATP-binding protein [Pelosinus baikalensis]|uniref:ATP-binding protein n=1 Tax=Pelosinus baikalensis TaxID=2892015 RepID=A0ABS8HR76_9FIRM|nr:ATP-binding protein [Pelosinus baikalensis]
MSGKTDCPHSIQHCENCVDGVYNDYEGNRIKYLTSECRKQQVKAKMLSESGLIGKDITETFQKAKIDSYNKGPYNYLQNKWNRAEWLYIWSRENGTGKSYTANAIANMLLDEGIRTLVKREVDMANEIQETFSDKSGECEYALMGKWKGVAVLIIQDVGKYGCKSEWWPQRIYDIIDYRLINNKTTIFTSNYNIEYRDIIEQRFGENHGGAIFSRLNGLCTIFEMDGEDRRIKN